MERQLINKADYSGESVELVRYKNGNFRADYHTGNIKMINDDIASVTFDESSTVITVYRLGKPAENYWYAICQDLQDYSRDGNDPLVAAVQLAFNII